MKVQYDGYKLSLVKEAINSALKNMSEANSNFKMVSSRIKKNLEHGPFLSSLPLELSDLNFRIEGLEKSLLSSEELINQSEKEALEDQNISINNDYAGYAQKKFDPLRSLNNPVIGGNVINNAIYSKKIVDIAMAIYNDDINSIYKRSNIGYVSPGKDKDGDGNSKYRSKTYNGEMVNGKFKTDCNGFVSLVLREAIGIGPEKGDSKADDIYSYTFFCPGSFEGSPSYGSYGPRNEEYMKYFKFITSDKTTKEAYDMMASGEIVAGDIIGFNGGSDTHIAIYAGDYKVIENSGEIFYRPFDETKHWGDGSKITVWRVNEELPS
jgi:hypothetical protein